MAVNQSQCFKVLTGVKRQFFVADYDKSCAAPLLNTDTTGGIQPAISWKIPLGASVTAPIAKGATTVATGTLPTGLTRLFIPGGFYVPYTNTDGSTGWVRLTADYTEASATMAVEATGRAIKVGATFEYPVPLGGVTDAVYNPTVNAIRSDGGGTGGFNSATPGTSESAFDLTVEVDFLDAGMLNLQAYRDGKGSLYGIVVYRGGALDYSPYFVEGGIMVASQSFPSPRNGLISGATQLPLINKAIEHQPAPVG